MPKSVTTIPTQDPRPISDKTYMSSSIKTIIRYLVAHGFGSQDATSKLFANMTTKGFQGIVEFLYRQIDPGYVMTSKFEDAIPAIFKSLGYPFQISKTALYAAGAPHTWPALLAALTWLVELLTYQEIVEERDAEAADSLVEENAEKLFFNYLSKAYTVFMLDDNGDMSRIDDELDEQFKKRSASVTQTIAELEVRCAAAGWSSSDFRKFDRYEIRSVVHKTYFFKTNMRSKNMRNCKQT